MNVRRRLTAALRPVAAPMVVSVVARVFHLVANLVLVAAGAWGAAALAAGTLSDPWALLLGLAAAAAVKAVASYVEQYQGHHVAFGLLAGMRTDFFRRVAPLAPAALGDTRSGDLVDRVMSDVDRVEVFYAHTVAPVVAGMVVPAFTAVGVGLWAGPAPALILAASMVLVGLVVPALSTRVARRSSSEAAARSGDLAAHITDGVQGLGEAVIFDYGSRRVGEMAEREERLERTEATIARIDGVRAGLNRLITAGALIFVAGFGGESVQAGEMDPAVLAGTLAIALVGFTPLRDLQQVKPDYDRAMAAAERVFSISDRRPAVTDPSLPADPPGPRPSLAFESVTFAYPGREAAVRDIDLAVRPGRRVAVVGPSGAGKSTLAALAVRFWDPDGGRITLDSTDISSLELSDLRGRVTVVTQGSRLLSGTVADNLRLGRPEATPEEMRQAAAAAAVGDDIASLPEGYETQVGELGVRLSGGQRQRIALARGLLSGAPVLILDEATSELDVDTEARVLERLEAALADRALLLITHRLVAAVDADEVLVVDEGRVVERGTHDDLLARQGRYARLWARQADEI